MTNASGYFEAPLLQAGPYRVTVDMAGFKGLTQSGITLSVGQSLTLKLTLEVGAISERIDVSATAPLLDTTSVSSGQNFDQALIAGLPMASNMPMLLARFAQGVVSPTTQVQVISGQIDGPTNAAGTVVGGVGGFNYTVDGATNAGSSRRIASSPNADMIEEMRVETSNFDAAQGHGTGGTIAMMTRAGSNSLRGTANYQYWTNKINSLNPQQKLAFSQRPETGKIYEGGYENYIATTLGGPVVIPRLIDGRNKLFFFANYQRNYDNAPAQSTPTSTIPANEKHLNGDFSDLLALPNGGQYQIYDPLTVRPDPARPGSLIRTPFPNNIIPRDRFMNPNGTYKSPLFALYKDMAPQPNQNFVEQGQVPTNNYYQGGIPNQVTAPELRRTLRLQPLGLRPVLLPGLRHDVLRVQRRLDLRDEVRRAARQRQDARLVVVHRQLDQGPQVHGHRHAVLGQPLLRGSAAAGAARVQAQRRRSADLPGRVLPGGEQLHAADHQHHGVPGCVDQRRRRLARPPISRRRAASRTSWASTRCAAASTTAWRCARPD